ncbi:processive 1,2-diacylglycerol beta-glucosyltransferase [Dethiosulfatibacter aminovorans DSM 17477]|uniref:Processive 1,2-diacylglycerol beta-glucosyltransferase n=1 Tax=Dethiosulfatibacter aminovorans DSM 17477 TaxID=1121476 RepID=A0A1M6HT72_9FIRM|nr:glycosyltransferase [Dethiosulfatibacter aminovorans]SHJ25348.1 processive 1,2-diacylglycerol beta-glucosyltransferase [Dethiosulfatibacter aminovorans DSM 17477]
MKKINILILTAPFGNGHKMAAQSLKETFSQQGCNVLLYDIFTESHPIITNNISRTYERIFNLGNTYSRFYYGIDRISRTKLIHLYGRFGYSTLKVVTGKFKPDIIVNTFPVMSAAEYSRKIGYQIPVVNVVTDYCCHRLWINDNLDRIYLATDDLKKKLQEMNIPTSKLEVTGIPIRTEFEKNLDMDEVYTKYGIKADKKTVLISAGANGLLKDPGKLCRELNRHEELQTIIVCGNNGKLKRKIDSMNLKNIHSFGYIDEIHELYKIADLMVTKPGGITLSEAAAANLPLILYKPVPGQEKENAEYFKSKGAALIAKNTSDVASLVLKLVNSPKVLKKMKRNLRRFYNPESSKRIVDDLLSRHIM